MSEATQQQPTEPTQNDAAELATLRTTVRELREKSTARKKLIRELETALSERDSQLATANASLKAITIDAPLKDMSEVISTAPSLWTKLFNEHYRLELKDGALKLLTVDGQPVQKDGKDAPFERQALISLLTDEKHPAARDFAAITIVSRATGGLTAPSQSGTVPVPTKPTFQFGLR